MRMTPGERVMAAVKGQPFDVCPAISATSVATVSAMKSTGAFFPAAHTNAFGIADLAAAGHELFGFDSVAPYFSIHLEAAALGVDVDWGDPFNMPKVKGVRLERIEDASVPSGILEKRELRQLLKAIRILRERYGEKVPVIGKVVGPWTLAYHLRGVENLLIDTLLEPDKTQKAIEALSALPVAFAKAQFEAGAAAVVWADHMTSDLVSAELYKEMLLPVHKRAMLELSGYGPIILHTCGNVMDRIGYFAEAGFTCFHMDSRNPIRSAVQQMGDRIRIIGGINNPVTLSQGTWGRVRREAESTLRSGVQLIAPECAIPMNVSSDNLRELVKTVHRCTYEESMRYGQPETDRT